LLTFLNNFHLLNKYCYVGIEFNFRFLFYNSVFNYELLTVVQRLVDESGIGGGEGTLVNWSLSLWGMLLLIEILVPHIGCTSAMINPLSPLVDTSNPRPHTTYFFLLNFQLLEKKRTNIIFELPTPRDGTCVTDRWWLYLSFFYTSHLCGHIISNKHRISGTPLRKYTRRPTGPYWATTRDPRVNNTCDEKKFINLK
jgi:hypothetical protein